MKGSWLLKHAIIWSLVFFENTLVYSKECTNTTPQLASHTLRASLLLSSNHTLKHQIYSSLFHKHDHHQSKLDHLIANEESTWSLLNPKRRSLQQKHDHSSIDEEFKWAMVYRQLKHDNSILKLGSGSQAQSFLEEVPLKNVRLLEGSPQATAQETNLEYLLLLDVDRLVWHFRNNAGMPAASSCYGGWELDTSELRGHFVGHYMSATAKAWAATQNQTLYEKMTYLVKVLYECQKKIGTGYLSAFPSEFFDRFEEIQPVWAPYYTIHKIMTGLLDQYAFAGNDQALYMAVWMADYFYKRVKNVIQKHSIERHWYSLNEETGGMNDVLYRMYTLTGNAKHLELAHLFDKPCFLGLLAVKADSISGFHANTHIPVVIGAQMRHEVTGDPLYKEIGSFFMDTINSSHAFATGGTSAGEFWFEPKRLADYLSTENEESCTTYNMLKVARHLFRWTKAMAYADYYERALTNGVLGIQRGQEPGVMIYMLPFKPGSSKADTYHGWGTKFDSFWCCYGTAIESFSKLGDSIYFQEKSSVPSLYIVQFVSSMFQWDTVGLQLKQEVQPLSSYDKILNVSFEFFAQKDMLSVLYIRIPFWTYKGKSSATLNGKPITLPEPGNFMRLKRTWMSGDKLSLMLPVGLRTERIKDDRPQFQSLYAILFGPYLLAALSNGDWDLHAKNQTLNSITHVRSDHASQLFTFSREVRKSCKDKSEKTTFVMTENNTKFTMNILPAEGTEEAVHSTFRILPLENHIKDTESASKFVGKTVSIELFHQPGMYIAHQGINKNVSVSVKDENKTAFKVVAGLDGNKKSISLESTEYPGCYLYGAIKHQSGILQLKCRNAGEDLDFDKSTSYVLRSGISSYHQISFITRGLNRNYLLMPLNSLQDERYTVYLNVTHSSS